MNPHPLNQQLDTIDDTVTDHNAILTSALAEHSADEALMSSPQHQFEIHISVLTANLQSYTSIQRDIIDALHFHRTQRLESTAYPVPPAITAIALPTTRTSLDPSRAPEIGRYHFYGVVVTQRTNNRYFLYLGRVPSLNSQRSKRISVRGFNTFEEAIVQHQLVSITNLAYQLHHDPLFKQAHRPLIVGRSSIQPNSKPPMEAVPIQCLPKYVPLNGPHWCLLPRRPPNAFCVRLVVTVHL
jgi:hypothetical protein